MNRRPYTTALLSGRNLGHTLRVHCEHSEQTSHTLRSEISDDER